MQEEIENRTVTLIISAVKLTARELKAGMDKYLSEKKSKAMEKARAAPEKPSGKTRFFIKPNLMQLHSSYVVTDPKGSL